MITDHGAVNRQATALAVKLGVTPEDNGTSQQLMAGADESAAKLRAASGADFDRAYMDREVAYHEAVLAALDNTLVPSAQNAELKALMIKVRPAFVAHLDHARRIQASLAEK
jgi:putative membrane protein